MGLDSESFHAKLRGYPDYFQTGQVEIHESILPPDFVIIYLNASKEHLHDWNWYGYGAVSIEGSLSHIAVPVLVGFYS